MTQKIFFEENITSLAEEVNCLCPKTILCVTGSSSYAASGAKVLVDRLFGKYNIVSFNNFSVNPKLEELKNGIALCRDVEIDFIVAIGGGSVIDMAKLMRCYVNSSIELTESVKTNKVPIKQKIPFAAIPTTAGSGSESTHFAVVYIDGNKYSLSHASILPDYVLLAPSLTYGSPSYLTACSGADALCQAIESYWSVQSTEESRGYARRSILLLWQYLSLAIENDFEARNKVMLAANLAGRAINISFTTAAHAYSYGLTTYAGIPHGHAVSLTLPYFFDLNMKVLQDNCNDKRGAEFVKERIGELLYFLECTTENAVAILSSFFYSIFGEMNDEAKERITSYIRGQVTLSVNVQRLQNNQAKVTKEDIEGICFY